MVRNAGGRAFDAIRTLSVLQTIGNPGTIVVLHHTGKSVFIRFVTPASCSCGGWRQLVLR
jgi:hypothetical protein